LFVFYWARFAPSRDPAPPVAVPKDAAKRSLERFDIGAR
jgi:hypothetical protein